MEQKILIIFLVLFLIPLVSGEEILLDLPKEVEFGEEFEVEVELLDFEDDLYDVKIDLTDDSGNRLSQIYDGIKWQSTFRYVNEIITPGDMETFTLKIVK